MATQYVRILPFIDKPALITSKFWEDRGGRPHRGVDLSASGNNIPLYSMTSGYVVTKSFDATGYGNYVIIKDLQSGLGFLYAHLNNVRVNVGDVVVLGEEIGSQGSTGSSTGNHLHLEMQDLSSRNWIYGGNRSDYINPADWIPYVETIGDYLYYDGIPKPITNEKKKKFKWVLYSNKLRKRNVNNM